MEKRKSNRDKMNQNKRLWQILLLVCIACFLISGIVFGIRQYHQKREECYYQVLAGETVETEMMSVEVNGESESVEETETDILELLGIEIPEKNIDFNALREENADIYAWIYVPGTNVDYPVLQHPTDDSFYLSHNLDGSAGYPSCIYSESLNSKDFTDPNTVLYGHNMDNGTMFGSLHNFEDEQNFEGNHYIFIYTPEKTYVYQIFAAYEYPAIHLLYNFDLSDPEVYTEYLEQIYEVTGRVANIRQDICVNAGQRIITLSTCTRDHENSLRYLVQGVLLNDEE